MDLQELVGPAHTALCIVECQNGVVGPESSMAAVADAVAKAGFCPVWVAWPQRHAPPG